MINVADLRVKTSYCEGMFTLCGQYAIEDAKHVIMQFNFLSDDIERKYVENIYIHSYDTFKHTYIHTYLWQLT